MRSSGSYLSQNDLRLHFGLAGHSRADKVEVFWPSGATDRVANFDADRSYCLKEGAGRVPCSAIRPMPSPNLK